MNLPNKLTMARFFLTPIGIWVLFLDQIPFNILISTGIFLFGMALDVADGIIARKFELITKLGTFLDPLADKLLILLYFMYLQNTGIYPLWLLMVFFGREMIVDAFRSFAVGQNIYVSAIIAGKTKALLQTISITAGLIYLAEQQKQLFNLGFDPVYLKNFAFITMLLGLFTSVIGLHTLLKQNSILFREKNLFKK